MQAKLCRSFIHNALPRRYHWLGSADSGTNRHSGWQTRAHSRFLKEITIKINNNNNYNQQWNFCIHVPILFPTRGILLRLATRTFRRCENNGEFALSIAQTYVFYSPHLGLLVIGNSIASYEESLRLFVGDVQTEYFLLAVSARHELAVLDRLQKSNVFELEHVVDQPEIGVAFDSFEQTFV
jgi:hypothetical protein